jgi:hypothetical protein
MKRFSEIGRVLGLEIKRFVDIVSEIWKGFNQSARLYCMAGEDSVPCKEDQLYIGAIDGSGKYVILGVLDVSQGAKPGEKIYYGRDQKRNTVSKIKMLNDGLVSINTLDETTGEAKGGYVRKIKGATDIYEKENRVYKNDKDVDNTILGNKNETIKKNFNEKVNGEKNEDIDGDKNETAGGKFYFGNSAQNACKLLLGLIDEIEMLKTFGPPPRHRVQSDSIARLEAYKNQVRALYKENT